MYGYRDRKDAGQHLAAALEPLQLDRPVVLGIPRGGVPVGAEVARILNGELGVVVARKVGAPGHPELGIGAVTADGTAYLDPDLVRYVEAGKEHIDAEVEREVEEARRRESAFDGRSSDIAGRNVIVVDDGLATGVTAVAALRAVRNAGASRVVLGVPVAPPSTIEAIRAEADDIVCPLITEDFGAVGRFYIDFAPPKDQEVRELLAESASR